MPADTLSQKVLLPELRLLGSWAVKRGPIKIETEKKSTSEVCPRCATPSSSVYDRRWVRLKDEPLRRRPVQLWVHKRRFTCKPCGKVFTEPVPGVRKGARTTERFRRAVMWACETYACLKDVRQHFRCSGSFVYDNLYPLLERRQRERSYPWPKVIGIDEHYFKRSQLGFREFVTMVVDFKGRRLFEVVEGRQAVQLELALQHIPGRENVKWVAIDLADPYKNFVRSFFPNAQIIADKFHVLRLLNPALNRRRKEITGDRRSLKVRRLLLKNGHRLKPVERFLMRQWLEKYPALREVYFFKEALHRLYRTRGKKKAEQALTRLTDAMASSLLPEIQTLRKTLIKWRNEILAYFYARVTNARTEGFNNVAKVVKKRGYGYRSFKTYRLTLLQACS